MHKPNRAAHRRLGWILAACLTAVVLAAAAGCCVPRKPRHARLYLVDGLAHVDVEGFGLRDTYKLMCAVGQMLTPRR